MNFIFCCWICWMKIAQQNCNEKNCTNKNMNEMREKKAKLPQYQFNSSWTKQQQFKENLSSWTRRELNEQQKGAGAGETIMKKQTIESTPLKTSPAEQYDISFTHFIYKNKNCFDPAIVFVTGWKHVYLIHHNGRISRLVTHKENGKKWSIAEGQ